MPAEPDAGADAEDDGAPKVKGAAGLAAWLLAAADEDGTPNENDGTPSFGAPVPVPPEDEAEDGAPNENGAAGAGAEPVLVLPALLLLAGPPKLKVGAAIVAAPLG